MAPLASLTRLPTRSSCPGEGRKKMPSTPARLKTAMLGLFFVFGRVRYEDFFIDAPDFGRQRRLRFGLTDEGHHVGETFLGDEDERQYWLLYTYDAADEKR